MLTLIRLSIKMIYFIVYMMVIAIALFICLCMNVFTIPLYLLLYLVCKLFKFHAPKARMYGLMLYPSWSATRHFTFMGTLEKLAKRSEAKAKAKERRSFTVTHAWEERFFM